MFSRASKNILQNQSDEKLVRQYQKQPSQNILAELYRRYRHLVFGVSMKYLDNKADSEDLMMDIFEKLGSRLDGSTISNFKSWLYSLVRNEAISILRKTQRERIHEEEHEIWEKRQENFVEIEEFERLLYREHLENNLLIQALDQLKKEQRQCLELFFYKKLTYQDIQNVTGYTPKMIKSYLQNGKRNLRMHLKQLLVSE